MFASDRTKNIEGSFNDTYLKEQPVSIIATNLGSFMGGRHDPWMDSKNSATSIYQTTTDPNVSVEIKPAQTQVIEPSKKDGFIEFTSANSIIGMGLGVFHRIG
jgi:hypothetical protein